MHAFMPSAGTVDVRELKIAMRALGFDVKKRQVRVTDFFIDNLLVRIHLGGPASCHGSLNFWGGL